MRFLFFIAIAGFIGYAALSFISWLEGYLKAKQQAEVADKAMLSEVDELGALLMNKGADEIRAHLPNIQERIAELGGMDGETLNYLKETAKMFTAQDTAIRTLSDSGDPNLHEIKSYSAEYRKTFADFVETLLLSNRLNREDGLNLALEYHQTVKRENERLSHVRDKSSSEMAESFRQSLADLNSVREIQNRSLSDGLPDLKR